MPQERFLTLNINNKNVDLPNTDEDLGFRISYTLEEPENFMSKQGADPQNITLPASKNNDQIFNTFHNPQVEDLSPADGAIMTCAIYGGGSSGWAVGNLFEISGYGTMPAVGEVTAVSGGVVTAFILIYIGDGYSVVTSTPAVPLTGSGIDLDIQIEAVYVGTASFRELMPCTFSVNGSVPVMTGYALLTDCSFTDKPESYDLTLYASSGQWVIDLQNVTLWDCVNPLTHTFDVATVKGSWSGYSTFDPDHDFVYAPVRYSQPFDGTTLGYQGDNCVNIYHLRPAISILRIIQRAFNNIGYQLNSQVSPDDTTLFFNTNYAKGLVLPWVWGDFYDINSELVQGVCFKVVGELPSQSEPPPLNGISLFSPFAPISLWCGLNSTNASLEGSPGGSSWWRRLGSAVGGWVPGAYVPANGIGGSVYNRTTNTYVSFNGVEDFADSVHPSRGTYIFTGNGTSSPATNDRYIVDINTPPNGFDSFMLTSFDNTTGAIIYKFNPPDSLAGTMSNVSATFVFSVYLTLGASGTGQFLVTLEVVQTALSGVVISYNFSLNPHGGAWIPPGGSFSYPNTANILYPLTPSNLNFTIPNMNPGDHLTFRMRIVDDGSQVADYGVISAGYLNNNPAVLGVPAYSYNFVTETFEFITPNVIWSPLYSSLNMTGFLVQLGNTVSLQNYDAFRNFQILDLFGGMIDAFDFEVSTDNINKVVTIEPMFGSTLPTGETIGGYFSATRILDYTLKRDISIGKGAKMSLFNATQRQLDLTFKLDSSDNAQTIWAQRYKGIYLNNRTYTGGINQNNINIDNGLIAAVPGAARYMLPNRFAKGNNQMTNRFFGATMHVPFPQWTFISGVTPQLICMFPDDATGDTAISQAYTPKLAYYKGEVDTSLAGGWIFIGDPAACQAAQQTGGVTWTEYQAGSIANPMPFMFAVNYVQNPNNDPVLSYSDENINGVQVPGLLTQFYLQRFAIMRNGQLLNTFLRLNLNDICNWEHQESITIDGCLYALISIDGYNPLTDDSTSCTLWKIVLPEIVDKANCYPSTASILTQPLILPNSYDLRYHQLLLYPVDLPQVS